MSESSASPEGSVSDATSTRPVGPTGLSRDELALAYFEQLPFTPYPVQEQALYAWFGSEQGVLVCAPTGTGKTLIAEAAAFEALHNRSVMYYTTPLIALTDQKFLELQEAAVRWGFSRDDVGLVTGNRKVNPQARVLVVVAEILLNRLLQPDHFQFENVSAVVMDEFHSFADPERGIVWEFSLSLLPKQIRLMLLSATVGNAVDFLSWLRSSHHRDLDLVQGTERKVPLQFNWVGDKLLTELLPDMAQGDAEARYTPALVFCFNREECWSVAEELKGKDMLAEGQQKQLVARLAEHDWTQGAGPKLKQILMRGVGVHHAGLLPKYRRIVEKLFQQKLLSVCVCTETLSAGINLPARSVVIPSLLKGPPGKQKVIDASSAHQIFGRAGRPQFDSRGYVFALPHEDDVRILRAKEKLDQIPEDTKDPGLLAARKSMKKKMPTRSPNRQYWNEAQFEKLRLAPPRHLASQGPLPWRMLAYMLQLSPDVERVRHLIDQRLLTPKQVEEAEKQLCQMLITLHALDVVRLEPPPPAGSLPKGSLSAQLPSAEETAPAADRDEAKDEPSSETSPAAEPVQPESKSSRPSAMAQLILQALQEHHAETGTGPLPSVSLNVQAEQAPTYRPLFAYPTERLREFFLFRGINPAYALFLLDLLGEAEPFEQLQLFESVLELPGSLVRHVRVPPPDRMPPGKLARERVDVELVRRGVVTANDLYPAFEPDLPPEERKYPPPLGDKVKMLFDACFPGVHGVFVMPVWAAGDLLEFGYKFNSYITGRNLAKQEGLLYRHLLRLVLLLEEFRQVTPRGMNPEDWQAQVGEWIQQFTICCQEVDPQSTETMLASAHAVRLEFSEAELAEQSRAAAATLQGTAPSSDSAPTAIVTDIENPLPTDALPAEAVLEDDFGSGLEESEE